MTKRIIKGFTDLYVFLFYKVKVRGINNVPDSGSFILCSNHMTMIDMLFIAYKVKRWIYWMAKEELFRNFLTRSLFNILGAFPIKRGKADIQSFKKAFSLLDNGKIVGMFPQGTRSKGKNNLKVKPGAAMLALKSGVPIIPVNINGSFKLFSKIIISYGVPFYANEGIDNDKYDKDNIKIIGEKIMSKINELSEANI